MMSSGKFARATAAGFAALLVVAIGAATPARAADPVFPTGSRVGLVPPPGMAVAETFSGFADPNKDAAILIAILPTAAYSQIDKSMDAEALKKQGVNLEKREPMQLSFGKGFLLTGRQVADKVRYRKWLLVAPASDFTALISVQVPEDDPAYPDRVVREALATLTVRPQVPEAEQLSLLPFTVGDLAGFHVDAVLRGRALLLSDAPIVSNSAKEIPATPARLRACSSPPFRAARRTSVSTPISHGCLSTKLAESKRSRSHYRSRCALTANPATRPWRRQRTRRAVPT